jgi:hypothetical protein
MRQPRRQLPDRADLSAPQTAIQSPTQKTNLNPRHTTNPPDSCLSRGFMIGDLSEGRGRAKEALAAPPGGRLWHGFAVRRPPVGRGGRGLTFGLIGGGGFAPVGHPMQMPTPLDIGGMERKPAPVAFFTERTLASFLAVSDRTTRPASSSPWSVSGDPHSDRVSGSQGGPWVTPAPAGPRLIEGHDRQAGKGAEGVMDWRWGACEESAAATGDPKDSRRPLSRRSGRPVRSAMARAEA